MVGMQVVVTKCDENGNVDMVDLKAKCEQHSQNLACVMITYPSTHGVFETSVKELCELVHSHGGRVYVDGANMNALVGVAARRVRRRREPPEPAQTFCIPTAVAAPASAPVCVVEDLVPFLPGHATGGVKGGTGAVSAAPLGNAAVLPISWMYIRMMGRRRPEGRHRNRHPERQLHQRALKDHYPTLYASEGKAPTAMWRTSASWTCAA